MCFCSFLFPLGLSVCGSMCRPPSKTLGWIRCRLTSLYNVYKYHCFLMVLCLTSLVYLLEELTTLEAIQGNSHIQGRSRYHFKTCSTTHQYITRTVDHYLPTCMLLCIIYAIYLSCFCVRVVLLFICLLNLLLLLLLHAMFFFLILFLEIIHQYVYSRIVYMLFFLCMWQFLICSFARFAWGPSGPNSSKPNSICYI